MAGDVQSFSDAQAHYYQQKVTYFAKLEDKLTKGEISQSFYDGEVAKFSGELEDPNSLLSGVADLGTTFWKDVSSYASDTYGVAADAFDGAGNYIAQGAKAVYGATAGLVQSGYDAATAPIRTAVSFFKYAIMGIGLIVIYFFFFRKK